MAEQFSCLNEKHKTFIADQKIFFVSTAAPDGYINLSPKGMDSFRALDDSQIAWLNMTGSGNETAAHLKQIPRMTVMFCSFNKQPLILRLYGTARAIHKDDTDWKQFAILFPDNPGARQIFIMDIELVQTSCGYAVPHYEFTSERKTLTNWAEKKGDEGIREYWQERNTTSLNGVATGIPVTQDKA